MFYPDATYWLNVHIQFTQGANVAWEEVAAYFLPQLCQSLLRRRPDVDEQLISESVENALMDYRKDPHRFDASRGAFLGYWLMIQARGHLSHLLRREKRHQAKTLALGVADKIFEKSASKMGYEMAIYRGGKEDELEEQQQFLESLLPSLSLLDRAGVEMLLHGAAFDEWVDHLGIAHLSTAEQHRNVNAGKSRIKKKLHRLARRWRQ